MGTSKPLISEPEWVKFCIRENKRVPRDKMPHCFGMPVLSMPECNHLVGSTKNLCSIRQSCALAYAERLKIDTSSFTKPGNQDYPALVEAIRAEEARIRFVPELGKSAPKPVDGEEVSMASIIPKEEAPTPKVAQAPKSKPHPQQPVKKAAPAAPKSTPIWTVILDTLASFPDWVQKAELISALEDKLNRRPLNSAVLHKVSLVLLPKSQAKHGYKIEKKVEKMNNKQVYSYKLVNATPKTE